MSLGVVRVKRGRQNQSAAHGGIARLPFGLDVALGKKPPAASSKTVPARQRAKGVKFAPGADDAESQALGGDAERLPDEPAASSLPPCPASDGMIPFSPFLYGALTELCSCCRCCRFANHIPGLDTQLSLIRYSFPTSRSRS